MKSNFDLMDIGKFSLTEIQNMIIYEKDVYRHFLEKKLQDEANK